MIDLMSFAWSTYSKAVAKRALRAADLVGRSQPGRKAFVPLKWEDVSCKIPCGAEENRCRALAQRRRRRNRNSRHQLRLERAAVRRLAKGAGPTRPRAGCRCDRADVSRHADAALNLTVLKKSAPGIRVAFVEKGGWAAIPHTRQKGSV